MAVVVVDSFDSVTLETVGSMESLGSGLCMIVELLDCVMSLVNLECSD